MRTLGRIALTVVALIALLHPVIFGAFGSSSASTQTDPVVISDYQGQFTVTPGGDLIATETLIADFPSSPAKHGIFRFFDTTIRAAPNVRLSVDVTDITMDGQPVNYSLSSESDGRYLVAKIGDPNSYVNPGAHTYVISYQIPDMLLAPDTGEGSFASSAGTAPTDAKSVFYWNVVANGWRMSIDRATAVVKLPEAAAYVQCSAGSATGPCQISGQGTDTITLSSGALAPMTGMTTRIPLLNEQPTAKTLPWSATLDPVLGRSVPLAALVGLLTVLGAAAGAFWEWRSREAKPGFPVMYSPPQGLGPVQTVYMDTETVGDHALVASLLRAADLNLVKLFNNGDQWTVQGITYPQYWATADPVTAAVGSALGLQNYGSSLTADKSTAVGKMLQAAQKSAVTATKSWGQESKSVVSEPMEKLGKTLWLVAIVLAAVGLVGFFTPTMYGLPFAAFAIAGLGLRAAGVGTRRTQTGRRLWSESGGFRRMLSTPSSEQRFDFSARQGTFITYLPYAVAFGVADKWAEKYRAEMHEDPPIPMWYPMGYGTHGLFSSGGGFDSFSDSLSSTIGAYEASQRSSSGSGGGGFSGGFGGGGGGGGGGSW